MKVLVTGGCGYIGSHTIIDLIDHGFEVVSVDNNVRSNARILEGVTAITGKTIHNYTIDLCDFNQTRQIFEEHPDIKGVIHFAALKSVAESVNHPLRYFQNNINSLLNTLACIKAFNIPYFVFSSSCSVYGNATELPVTETTPLQSAQSPYGRTKQIGEYIIQDFATANPDIHSVILRYFNPAGAHESAIIGEVPFGKPIYLVPVITDTAMGRREQFIVFGDDYPTRDGSCIRDYIHIMDLANAHTKALQYQVDGIRANNCEVFNLGIGQGVSVLEAIHAFEKVTSQTLNYHIGKRRAGDVVAIYSDYSKASKVLGWQPSHTIDDIMATAWRWGQQLYTEKRYLLSDKKS